MTTKWITGIAVLLAWPAAVYLASHGGSAAWAYPANTHSTAYQSAEKKINYLTANGRREPPVPATTTLTAEEINAYVAEGGIALPAGIQRVRFSSIPAVVTGAARVDFDQITAAHGMTNPLLAAFFTGIHDVLVEAQATGSNGTGSVRLESMAIDGVQVPQMAMQFFIDRYLKPKYGPKVGLDGRFRLPARIDLAIVENNQVRLTQR